VIGMTEKKKGCGCGCITEKPAKEKKNVKKSE
jgi:hypothetical protein